MLISISAPLLSASDAPNQSTVPRSTRDVKNPALPVTGRKQDGRLCFCNPLQYSFVDSW